MRVRINKEKLEEAKKRIKPQATLWALGGIVFFFFVPEIIVYLWGDELKNYFLQIASLESNPIIKQLYEKVAKMLSQNSILNIAIGFGFVYWWYHERKRSKT